MVSTNALLASFHPYHLSHFIFYEEPIDLFCQAIFPQSVILPMREGPQKAFFNASSPGNFLDPVMVLHRMYLRHGPSTVPKLPPIYEARHNHQKFMSGIIPGIMAKTFRRCHTKKLDKIYQFKYYN